MKDSFAWSSMYSRKHDPILISCILPNNSYGGNYTSYFAQGDLMERLAESTKNISSFVQKYNLLKMKWKTFLTIFHDTE